jgi:hypothetical protein
MCLIFDRPVPINWQCFMRSRSEDRGGQWVEFIEPGGTIRHHQFCPRWSLVRMEDYAALRRRRWARRRLRLKALYEGSLLGRIRVALRRALKLRQPYDEDRDERWDE